MGGQLPGPVCRQLKARRIDTGTLCRNTSPVPRPVGTKPSSSEIRRKQLEYLEYAIGVSYLMQAKSEGESAESWIEQELKSVGGGKSKPRRVQSFLGGAFLRMYLDGKKDPKVIAEAGVEIGASPEFKRLTEDLSSFLQTAVDHHHLINGEPDKLLVAADRHLKAKLKPGAGGIAFRYTLNAVIGGVTGVDVESVTLLSDASTSHGLVSKYRVDINFSDTYDFENKRKGEYDHYRKQLARYLIADDFEKFEDAYSREAHHPFDKKIHKTHLDSAAVFASFMYALEQKKWTPGGLAWDVTVPAEITLVFKPSHHAGSALKAHGR